MMLSIQQDYGDDDDDYEECSLRILPPPPPQQHCVRTGISGDKILLTSQKSCLLAGSSKLLQEVVFSFYSSYCQYSKNSVNIYVI